MESTIEKASARATQRPPEDAWQGRRAEVQAEVLGLLNEISVHYLAYMKSPALALTATVTLSGVLIAACGSDDGDQAATPQAESALVYLQESASRQAIIDDLQTRFCDPAGQITPTEDGPPPQTGLAQYSLYRCPVAGGTKIDLTWFVFQSTADIEQYVTDNPVCYGGVVSLRGPRWLVDSGAPQDVEVLTEAGGKPWCQSTDYALPQNE